jgi:UDP-N-acetylglucosamine transferase subunit ALG13
VFDFIDEDRFLSMINEAKIVVTHGGFGILATLINMKKKIVAVPREECYGEATNPQIELVRYLEMKGALIGVYNIADLHGAIQKAEKFELKYKFENPQIPHIVKDLIDGYRGLNGE